MSESISTAAYYTVEALPFTPGLSDNAPKKRGHQGPIGSIGFQKELCRGFSVDFNGQVILTREDDTLITLQCVANVFYPLRFKLAAGSGNILAVW
tara:strand:- start:2606 stop:2890 length:285 start_codon:yes stop_codon:yes gene_type:complete